MKQSVMIAAMLALAACARPSVQAANENSVIIAGVGAREVEALSQADAHCARYGRTAALTGVVRPGAYAFNCVSR